MPEVFVTLKDVSVEPNTTTSVIIYLTTDASVKCKITWWPITGEIGTAGSSGVLNESTAAIGRRGLMLTMGLGHAGKTFGFSITNVDPPPAPTIRLYTGTFQWIGARDPYDIPVRFNGFSGPMTAPVPALGVNGNWSRYTWSQWNPRGT